MSVKEDKILGERPNPNDLPLIIKIVIAYLGFKDVESICWGGIVIYGS